MSDQPQNTKNGPLPSTQFAETLGKSNCVNVDADSESKIALRELDDMGLSLCLKSDGGIGVKPAKLVDDHARDLIGRHRAGLVALLAERDPDPIRRGFLTGRLIGWRIAPNGERVEGLAPWHREWLDL